MRNQILPMVGFYVALFITINIIISLITIWKKNSLRFNVYYFFIRLFVLIF